MAAAILGFIGTLFKHFSISSIVLPCECSSCNILSYQYLQTHCSIKDPFGCQEKFRKRKKPTMFCSFLFFYNIKKTSQNEREQNYQKLVERLRRRTIRGQTMRVFQGKMERNCWNDWVRPISTTTHLSLSPSIIVRSKSKSTTIPVIFHNRR